MINAVRTPYKSLNTSVRRVCGENFRVYNLSANARGAARMPVREEAPSNGFQAHVSLSLCALVPKVPSKVGGAPGRAQNVHSGQEPDGWGRLRPSSRHGR